MSDFRARDAELRRRGLFAAEGRLLVSRGIAAGLRPVALFADNAAAEEARGLFPGVTVLEQRELSEEAGYPFHRGMLAHFPRPPFHDPLEVGSGNPRRMLAVPKITDPGNLGTLLRSALAFGFKTILLGEECLDPFNRKALRSSMGATYALTLCLADPSTLRGLAAQGVRVAAGALEAGAVEAGPFSGDIALVLGNEYDGIPPDWRAACAGAVKIGVSDEVDSLNVAVAGSIIMREISRPALP